MDNARYFFSSTAQSLAALVAIVLVMYNLVSAKIPNYESIFREHYPRFLRRYEELKKIKTLILISGICISFSLVSLVLIAEHKLFLFLLISINIALLLISLLSFIKFFTRSLLIAGKRKFFENCKYLLSRKMDFDILTDIRNSLEEFNANPSSSRYREILIDKEHINSLLNYILRGYSNQLLTEQARGSHAFYRDFKDTLKLIFDKKEFYDVWQINFHDIGPNLVKHVKMCIHDGHGGHHIKYIPDTIDILVELLDSFDKVGYFNLYEKFLKVYVDIMKTTENIVDSRVFLKEYKLAVIRENIAKNGLNQYDYFVKLFNWLNFDNKTKISQLVGLIKDYNDYYGDIDNEEDFKDVAKIEGAGKYASLDDSKIFLRHIRTYIQNLKSAG